jgi:methylmalonyl-CoA mutase cobalamin-binding subunit
MLDRALILPEPDLPDAADLLAEGQQLARTVGVGPCPFLRSYGVRSEAEYKTGQMAKNAIMFHAQFGYRNPAKSQRAYAEIHDRLSAAGYSVHRYGICLDWSMGYPAQQRANMPRGTGLILPNSEAFAALTQNAPVAPHFGDFVMGTPAALENTVAALLSGATSIGNLGQYFTFRLPHWDDDVGVTAETVKALALCAAQPVDILIHSNLDDGFASLFTDLACSLGAVLIEHYLVEQLAGGHVSHCYGHTFSDPVTRVAFQRALSRVSRTPGTMIYGNTTIFVSEQVENYANLASYLLVDILAQRSRPTGHALNPVPVTEATRIPEIDEIVDAHLFANRLAQRAEGFKPLLDLEAIESTAERLVEAGERFKSRVLKGLAEAGIDVGSPFELLLALRRIGARRLEEFFGPGQRSEDALRKRKPVVPASDMDALVARAERMVASLSRSDQEMVRKRGFRACVTCTDVHEYAKILVETSLKRLHVEIADAGVSADPGAVAEKAQASGADLIAISTYNGVALRYLQALRQEMEERGLDLPVFVGGKLNQIPDAASSGEPDDGVSSLPVDVTPEVRSLGAIVCHRVEDLLAQLPELARTPRP